MKQEPDKISLHIRFIQMIEPSDKITPLLQQIKNIRIGPGMETRNRLVAELLKQWGYFWEDEEK